MTAVELFKQPLSVSCAVVGITEQAEEERNALALAALSITAITTPEQQLNAVAVLRDIAAYINRVKEFGLAYRRPANQVLNQICELESDHLAPLIEAKKQGAAHLTLFKQQEDKRVADELAARERELAKLEEARLAAEQAAQAAASNLTSEAELQAAIAQEAAAKLAEQAWRDKVVAPLPSAAKAKGASTRRTMKVEILDLHALYRANPALVRLEPNLAAIKAICVPELQVDGIRTWWETDTSIRTW